MISIMSTSFINLDLVNQLTFMLRNFKLVIKFFFKMTNNLCIQVIPNKDYALGQRHGKP